MTTLRTIVGLGLSLAATLGLAAGVSEEARQAIRAGARAALEHAAEMSAAVEQQIESSGAFVADADLGIGAKAGVEGQPQVAGGEAHIGAGGGVESQTSIMLDVPTSIEVGFDLSQALRAMLLAWSE